MDPSEENRTQKKETTEKNNSFLLPAILLSILLCLIAGIYVFFNTTSEPPLANLESTFEKNESNHNSYEPVVQKNSDSTEEIATNGNNTVEPPKAGTVQTETPPTAPPSPSTIVEENISSSKTEAVTPVKQNQKTQEPVTKPTVVVSPTTPVIEDIPAPVQPLPTDSCTKPEERLDAFFKHLDQQAYLQAYKLEDSSEVHFTKLIHKLLTTPPKIARESDDLYTILRNTAHFFRVSGKDNILLLKGILDREKAAVEPVLADYYYLINTPECGSTKYAKEIDADALYEYACFFLNTMGGRLYLFRRDSKSRMVVTYYAILLVDLANKRQNNKYGIDLKSPIDLLISEMEGGASTLQRSEHYLDTLYDLKEAYQ